VIHERLRMLGARPNPALRHLPRDASWHVIAFALDDERVERVLETRLDERIYLYRYLPAVPPSYWDAMRPSEVRAHSAAVSRLVQRENGK
jgi:hypothetical protein